MTKQDAIKTAYGEYWEQVKKYVDDDGWICNSSFYIEAYEAIKEKEHRKGIGEWRPKSIQGIETNNNWIKIESEKDLPKDDYVYWVMRKDVKVPLYRKVEVWTDEEKEYWLETMSHYQPIIKPKPPIY